MFYLIVCRLLSVLVHRALPFFFSSGYKQNRIDTLNEDLNPSLALLTDWIVSSGNTTMSVDVLLHYLKYLGCDDIADIILQAKGALSKFNRIPHNP